MASLSGIRPSADRPEACSAGFIGTSLSNADDCASSSELIMDAVSRSVVAWLVGLL